MKNKDPTSRNGAKHRLPNSKIVPRRSLGTAGTILVIDDDDTVTEITARILNRQGFRVLRAANGYDGLAILKKEKEIDLVILDLIMPRLSGNETLSEIHHIRNEIPILISSGFSESRVATLFDGHAPDGYVKKPFRAAVLVEAVRNMLKTRERGA